MTAAVASEREELLPERTSRSPLDFLLLVMVLGFGLLGLRPLRDPDVWWHLRTGELVVRDGFTTSDPWSHASSEPWLLHEWGSEVVMYLAYELAGYRGVILLHALVMLALAAVLLASVRRVSTPLISVGVGALALIGVFLGSAERPQLASWVLLAATLPRLRSAVEQRRAPWWFAALVALWANVHGLWAAAVVIYGFLVLGLVWDVGVQRWREFGPFVAVGLASLVGACLTPNGPRLLLAPLHVREYAQFVGEWNAPSLLVPFFAASYALLGLVVVGWARTREPVSPVEISLVLGVCVVSLPYIRTMPILAIALAPLAAEKLAALSSEGRLRPTGTPLPALVMWGAGAVSLVLIASVWLPKFPPIASDAPVRSSAALDALPGRARVLNEYVLGSWIVWTARDTSPAIDGRTEIYAVPYVRETLAVLAGEPGWRQFVQRHKIDAAWLADNSQLSRSMLDAGWMVVRREAGYVVLVHPTQQTS